MPLAAYGGRREIMQKVAPLGPVYQAGTLSGNPVAVSAALALLERLDAGVYEKLEALGARLERASSLGREEGTTSTLCVQRVGSMITLFFTKGPVRSFARRREVRHDALRRVARRDARARPLLAAVAVRGRVLQRRARRKPTSTRRSPPPKRLSSPPRASGASRRLFG